MASSKDGVVGTRECVAALDKAAAAILEGARAATDAGAEALAEDMRRLVPVDSGELYDGITVIEGEDGTSEVGVVDVDHALPVEFGTENAPAQPYAMPAAELERQRLAGRVTGEVQKRVR